MSGAGRITGMQFLKNWVLSIKNFSVLEKIVGLIVVVVILRSLLPLAHTGFPATHDGEGHIARIANYAVSIRQGHFPPRIAPTFWNGYSYPIFNFHYPFLSIVGAPFVLAKIHPEVALKFWVVVGWLTLWIGTFLYTQKVTQNRLSGLVATLLAALNPYFYSLVYVRGSYGELFATAAAIWLLYFVEQRAQKNKAATTFNIGIIISSAVILLAHNIYAVLLFPCSLLYAVFRRNKTSLSKVLTEFLVGFGLTAFFWIPALLEKKYVRFDEQFSQFYLQHFVEFWQLLSSKVTFGISTAGTDDTISLGIGVAGLSVLVATIIYFVLPRLTFLKNFAFSQITTNKSTDITVRVAALLAVASIIVMLPVSLILWKTLFILPYFQFPWRFLGPLSIVLAVLGAVLWNTRSKVLRAILSVGLVVNLIFFAGWYWPTYTHFAPEYYLNYLQTATIYDEFRPTTFTVEPGNLSAGTPEIIGDGTTSDLKWRGTYRTYHISAKEPVTVVEPTMYFPGWKVWANGAAADLVIPDETGGEKNRYKGQVAYTVPAGEWDIVSKMTQQTQARLLGNSLSLVNLGILSWIALPPILLFIKKLRSHK